ncbi:MFS transporter [Nonomuraea sp. NPDC052129]|uniref:MFS transporter n=1 Tax=Nonomuraea sp. NPDC052129 TaxID=3154651 RepID=UPI00341DD161
MSSWGGTTYSWFSPQILALAAAAVLALAAFVAVERRTAEPVIPPRLFHDRDFTLAQILSFLVGAIMLSVTNYLPQYMQFVQGASPTVSGMLLPLMFGMLGAQLITGHLISRNGRYQSAPIGAAVLALIAFAASWLVRETPLREHPPAPAEPAVTGPEQRERRGGGDAARLSAEKAT